MPQPGDVVFVPCKVLEARDSDEYVNLELRTMEPMFPTDQPSRLSLNNRQVRSLEELHNDFRAQLEAEITARLGPALQGVASNPTQPGEMKGPAAAAARHHGGDAYRGDVGVQGVDGVAEMPAVDEHVAATEHVVDETVVKDPEPEPATSER